LRLTVAIREQVWPPARAGIQQDGFAAGAGPLQEAVRVVPVEPVARELACFRTGSRVEVWEQEWQGGSPLESQEPVLGPVPVLPLGEIRRRAGWFPVWLQDGWE
jgi:hypothetical protein